MDTYAAFDVQRGEGPEGCGPFFPWRQRGSERVPERAWSRASPMLTPVAPTLAGAEKSLNEVPKVGSEHVPPYCTARRRMYLTSWRSPRTLGEAVAVTLYRVRYCEGLTVSILGRAWYLGFSKNMPKCTNEFLDPAAISVTAGWTEQLDLGDGWRWIYAWDIATC